MPRPSPRLLLLAAACLVGACSASAEEPAAPAPSADSVDAAADLGRADRQIIATTTTTSTTTTTTAAPAPPTTTPPTTAPAAASAAAPPPAPAPAPAPPPAPQPAADPSGESQLVDLINQERARAGVAPLQRSSGVASTAREWATVMAREQQMRHNPDLGGSLRAHGVSGWRAIAENVGYGGSVSQVHSMFMASGGHRANILDPAYSQVGVGAVWAGGRVWIVVDFVGY